MLVAVLTESGSILYLCTCVLSGIPHRTERERGMAENGRGRGEPLKMGQQEPQQQNPEDKNHSALLLLGTGSSPFLMGCALAGTLSFSICFDSSSLRMQHVLLKTS